MERTEILEYHNMTHLTPQDLLTIIQAFEQLPAMTADQQRTYRKLAKILVNMRIERLLQGTFDCRLASFLDTNKVKI